MPQCVNARSVFVSLTALSVLGLAACGATGNKSDEPAGTNEPAGSVKQEETKKPIKLVIQNVYAGSPTAEEFMASFGTLIQQKFPHIQTIEYYSNSTRPLERVLVNKEQMDIVITSQGTFHRSFLANSLQTDLSSFIEKAKYDLNRLDSSSLTLVKTLGGGKLYGLPVDAGGTWLVYNKDLFDKFGVAYPSNNMTWEQMTALSGKLSRTEGGVTYHGAAIPPVNFLVRNPYALNHIDPATEKADFSNPQWAKMLQQIVGLYQLPGNEKTAAELGTAGALNLFRKDKVAAMYSPIIANDISLMFTFEDLNFDITQFPTMSGAPGNVQTYPNIYAVSSTSEHKADAFDVVAFMTSDDVQLAKSKRGTFPSLNNPAIWAAFGEEAPAMMKGKNLSILKEPNRYSSPSYLSEYTSSPANAELNTALNKVITGEIDLNTALREATEQANQKIEQAKSAAK